MYVTEDAKNDGKVRDNGSSADAVDSEDSPRFERDDDIVEDERDDESD